MARIAFLGIGNMGRGMAARLQRAGHTVTAFNRTAAKVQALADIGIEEAASPREAADGAEAIFSMVGDDAASRAVWLGPDGALAGTMRKGAFAIECSTISRKWVFELSEKAENAGLCYVDCPVTGLPDAAAAGKLTLFVGADPVDLKAVRPLLEPLCEEIMHFGPVGAGISYKLMVNLMGSVQIAGAAEGMAMAKRAGLDLDQVAYALAKGAAASPQVIRNSRRMADDDHDKDIVFAGRWRLKDTRYGLELAAEMDHPAPFGRVAGRLFEKLVADGHGDQNESKIIDAIDDAAYPSEVYSREKD